jgi:proton-dependent oligopeptide transporter, POT family
MFGNTFFSDLKKLPAAFWYLNLFQMLEKFAYWSVLLQLPIYISQKDVPGGLHWEQSVKGWIFLSWALVQNLTPVFIGGFADKLGYRKSLFFSFIFVASGYFIFGAVRDVYFFTAGAIILGFGLGIFKPVLQASISLKLKDCNESLGWGIYFMLYNAAVMLCVFASVYLKSLSWQMVFWGSAGVFSINFLLLLFAPKISPDIINQKSNSKVIKEIFTGLFERKVLYFVLIMSGFAFIFMQFYETYSNFIVDWVDTSFLVNTLSLPDMFTMKTSLGTMVSYEWIINLNPILIILFVALLSWMFSKFVPIKTIIIGMILCTSGFALLGFSTMWLTAIAGVIIYTFGEMTVNPKFTEYLSKLSTPENKARYLSYLNISLALGFGAGAISGGYLYRHLGEKAAMAADYLTKNGFTGKVEMSDAFTTLVNYTGKTALETNQYLWEIYHPYFAWFPFIVVGVLTIIGLIAYNRKFS